MLIYLLVLNSCVEFKTTDTLNSAGTCNFLLVNLAVDYKSEACHFIAKY